MKKLLRIHLNAKAFSLSALPDTYVNLGGRALTSRLLAEEVPPACDPWGDDNKLVFAAGILAGTAVPNSGRLSIGAKSPLTGAIAESNAGGSAAEKMARLGIQAIVCEGRAEEPVVIKVSREGATFVSANAVSLFGNQACLAHCQQQYGDGVAVISIGPAAEMQLRAATIAVSSPALPLAMAGQGGVAAVMGAKKVKMLIIDDSDGAPVEIIEQALFDISLQSFRDGLLARHCRQGGAVEGLDRVGRPVFSTDDHEALFVLGANCMIDDADLLARMGAACRDIGLDIMEVGGAIAMGMEGGLLPWGDGSRALAVVEAIGKGTELGRMFGNGRRAVAEHCRLNEQAADSDHRCQANPSPVHREGDPARAAGLDHREAESSPGSGHPCGQSMSGRDQAWAAECLQRHFAAIDSLGLCRFAAPPPLEEPELRRHLIDCVSAVLDESLDDQYLLRLGATVREEELKYARKVGLGSEENCLPDSWGGASALSRAILGPGPSEEVEMVQKYSFNPQQRSTP